MKWEIEKKPNKFDPETSYYIVKRNGKFVIAFEREKDAKEYIEIYGEGLEEMRKILLEDLK